MDNVLVIAGGAWQVPLIDFLKTKGYQICVADPYDDSPGVALADYHIKSDVREEEKIYNAIMNLQLQPKFIVTDQSDISVETANNLSHRLGLIANPKASINLFINKYFSREFAREIGTPIPDWQRVVSVQDLNNSIKKLGLPVILKPPDNQASCGIYKITESNINLAAELLKLSLTYSRTGYVLCEKYVEGIGITVEGFCSAGQHRCFASSVKDHFPSGVIASLRYPNSVPAELLQRIFAANDQYVRKSGLQFGITHGEYIVDVNQNKFWLVEIACRGGGTLVSSDIAHWVSGVSFYELLYGELKGDSTDLENLQFKNRSALLRFFEFGAGLVEDIQGVEEARRIPGVFKLMLSFTKGDNIHLAQNGRTRQGFYIALGETDSDIQKIDALVNETIKVRLRQESEEIQESNWLQARQVINV